MKYDPARAEALRRPLWQNALFSALSAVVLILAPGLVRDFFGAGPSWLFFSVGIGLLIFAADLLHQASRSQLSPLRAAVSSLADFFWVLGSLIFLVFFHGLISQSAALVVAAVAVIVLQFGFRQANGLLNLFREGGAHGKLVYRTEFSTQASPEAMWPMIADLGRISDYASNLAASRIKGNKQYGRGVIRECENHAGKVWTETCTEFVENRYLVLEFDTAAKGFPFPVSEMTGGWRVDPADSGSVVQVWWELVTKPRWAAFLILPLMVWQVERDFSVLLSNMEAAAMRNTDGIAL